MKQGMIACLAGAAALVEGYALTYPPGVPGTSGTRETLSLGGGHAHSPCGSPCFVFDN
jgi:hypothetical protein